jgi:hypothetical protein
MVKRNFNEVTGFSLYRGNDTNLLLPTAVMEANAAGQLV